MGARSPPVLFPMSRSGETSSRLASSIYVSDLDGLDAAARGSVALGSVALGDDGIDDDGIDEEEDDPPPDPLSEPPLCPIRVLVIAPPTQLLRNISMKSSHETGGATAPSARVSRQSRIAVSRIAAPPTTSVWDAILGLYGRSSTLGLIGAVLTEQTRLAPRIELNVADKRFGRSTSLGGAMGE